MQISLIFRNEKKAPNHIWFTAHMHVDTRWHASIFNRDATNLRKPVFVSSSKNSLTREIR